MAIDQGALMRPSGFRTPEDRIAYAELYGDAVRRAPIPVTERDVLTSFGTTHVLQVGDPTKPPLVALHAMSTSSVMWLPLLAVLAAEHHVHLLDAVGDMGLSTSTAPATGAADVVAWLDEALAACAVDRATFVGASMGAWRATHFAHAHPERVDGLALIGPVGLVSNLSLGFWTHTVPAVMVRPTPAKLGAYVDWMVMPASRERSRQAPWQDVRDLFCLLGTFRPNLREAHPAKADLSPLASCGIPTLVLVGRDECMHDGPEMAARFTDVWPLADVEVVDEARHLVFIDQTDLVSDRLRDFLGSTRG